ncbi:hypothetical protein DLD77_02820 [Chitinophaga alhagiae]|uniref:Uncharacterized protein n=1 Tax=Chitinophaga alhagiae TaxID=2203219 RepID=A0ABN5LWZ2_9BACT|nr:hypothetical protein [Chitinophaga alhagiae]AWO00702.1 hypothetical protein DLD77_02820 [Chitinophaga alhagiae]
MNNVNLTNRLQYIFLADNLTWEEFAYRAGENGNKLRDELLELLDGASELLTHIGYHIEIVKNTERIR